MCVAEMSALGSEGGRRCDVLLIFFVWERKEEGRVGRKNTKGVKGGRRGRGVRFSQRGRRKGGDACVP